MPLSRADAPLTSFLAFLLASLVTFHYWARHEVPPVYDASACVSLASRFAVQVQEGGTGAAARALRRETNILASVAYFTAASLAWGPGRQAWGWGWALAVAGLVAVALRSAPSPLGRAGTAKVLMAFLAGSPLLFRPGGLLDQRFDPLGALVLAAAAACLLERKLVAAAWLTLLAAAAKGPALPVGVLLWASLVITGALPIHVLGRDLRDRAAAWSAFVIAAGCYLAWALPDIVSYNLMASPGLDASAKAAGWLRSAAASLWPDRWFYPKAVLVQAPSFAVLVAGGVAALVAGRPDAEPRIPVRTAAGGFLLGALTYVLLSTHPLHNRVLVVWFAPTAWVLAAAGAQAASRVSTGRVALAATAAAALQLGRAFLPAVTAAPPVTEEARALEGQAAALARGLAGAGLEGRHVLVATSFSWAPAADLSYSPDTYRVLLFEAMGRRAPVLEAWVLGTRTDDWRAELRLLPGQEAILLLLAPAATPPSGPRGRAAAIAASVLATANPECAIALDPPGLPLLGPVRALLVRPDLSSCVPPAPSGRRR